MTPLVLAIVALTAIAAGLAWWLWAGHRQRQRDADAAARAYDEARAREAAAVEQAQRDEAAAMQVLDARRDEVLSSRDEAVAAALSQARARRR